MVDLWSEYVLQIVAGERVRSLRQGMQSVQRCPLIYLINFAEMSQSIKFDNNAVMMEANWSWIDSCPVRWEGACTGCNRITVLQYTSLCSEDVTFICFIGLLLTQFIIYVVHSPCFEIYIYFYCCWFLSRKHFTTGIPHS